MFSPDSYHVHILLVCGNLQEIVHGEKHDY